MCLYVLYIIRLEHFSFKDELSLVMIKMCIGLYVKSLDRPRGFQEVKAPRFCDNGTGWW